MSVLSKIVIIDYGLGNVRSVESALLKLGQTPLISDQGADILGADGLILPGVGAAGRAIEHLRKRELDQALTQMVREKGRPMLGICLGMQIIANTLHEYGEHQGLGWIAGDVTDLHDLEGITTRIPHMGWNSISSDPNAQNMFKGLRENPMFYFSHSYTLRTENVDDIAATVNAGIPIVAAIKNETIFYRLHNWDIIYHICNSIYGST